MSSNLEIGDLDVLIGPWRTEGEVVGDDGETPVARVEGYDHYEWLGRAFVIHRIDVEMSGEREQGLEVIGPYLGGRSFATRAYDREGGEQTSTATVDGDGMWGRADRAEAKMSLTEDRSLALVEWIPTETARRPGGRGCASRSRAGSHAAGPFHPATRLATLGPRCSRPRSSVERATVS